MAKVIRLRLLPATRAECEGPGVCPVLTCEWHMAHVRARSRRAIDGGSISALVCELHRMPHSCVLDAADDGANGPSRLAGLLGVSKQGAQQLVNRIIERARARAHTECK